MINGQVYTGKTADLRRRFSEHTNGKVDSTKLRRPLSLIGYEAYETESDATRREQFLKTTEGKRLFRQQYRDILQQEDSGRDARVVDRARLESE